jgi:hypothetical protein
MSKLFTQAQIEWAIDTAIAANGCTITFDNSQNTGYDWRVETPCTQFDTFATKDEARRFAVRLCIEQESDSEFIEDNEDTLTLAAETRVSGFVR